MKLRNTMIIIFLITFLFSGCKNTDEIVSDENEKNLFTDSFENAEKYESSNIEAGHYLLEHNESIIYLFENYVYAVGQKGIWEYTLPNMICRNIVEWETAPIALYVNQEGIYIGTSEMILCYSKNGDHLGSYDLTFDGKNNISEIIMTQIEENIWCICRLSDSDIKYQLYCINKPTGNIQSYEWNTKEMPVELEFVYSISEWECNDTDDLAIFAYYLNPAEGYQAGVIRYDIKKSMYKVDYSVDTNPTTGAYDPANGYVVAIDRNQESITRFWYSSTEHAQPVYFMYMDNERRSEEITKLLNSDVSLSPYIHRIFFTGSEILTWNQTFSLLSVYDVPIADSANTLDVLYAVDSLNLDVFSEAEIVSQIQEYSAANDIMVNSTFYDSNVFADQLRVKFLAGDNDFDIVYLSNANSGGLFSAILRYGLYMPLEDFPAITENFEEYIEGTRDVMSFDDHIYGIPVEYRWEPIVVTELYRAEMSSDLTSQMTYEDLWELCGETADNIDPAYGLLWAPYRWLLLPIIQQGVEQMDLDEEKIEKMLHLIDNYTKSNVFSIEYNDKRDYLLKPTTYPGGVSEGYRVPEGLGTTVLPPSENGICYAEVVKFVFANKNTRKPALAGEYLAFISEPQQIYKNSQDLVKIGNDSEAYYDMVWKGQNFNGDAVEYRWDIEKFEIDEYSKNAIANTQKLAPSLHPYTIDVKEVKSLITEIVQNGMLNGNLTPAEASEQLCDEIRYRYFE